MDIGYINPALSKTWIQETREISAMLAGLIKSVKLNTDNYDFLYD